VLLAPGGGSWSSVSDRESKENLEPVDPRAVLERVCALPISTWNYKAQEDPIRHMGPMAQDFRAAFELGVSDKLIDTVDPDGVALAAIQGLNARLTAVVAAKDAEIAELRERVSRLEDLAAELASWRPGYKRPSRPAGLLHLEVRASRGDSSRCSRSRGRMAAAGAGAPSGIVAPLRARLHRREAPSWISPPDGHLPRSPWVAGVCPR